MSRSERRKRYNARKTLKKHIEQHKYIFLTDIMILSVLILYLFCMIYNFGLLNTMIAILLFLLLLLLVSK